MTLNEITAAVAEIQACADDSEHAHILEDHLHQSVLQAIADGIIEDPRQAAKLALGTQDIEFGRWMS